MTVGVLIVGKAPGRKVGHAIRRGGSASLTFLAIVGVPISALILTGGISALGFWIEVVPLLFVSIVFGGWPFWIVGILPLMIVIAVLEKFFPDRGEIIGTILSGLIWVAAGTISFFQTPLGDSGVLLPASPPQLGALMVIGASLLTSSALLYTGSRLAPPPRAQSAPTRPTASPTPYTSPSEPEEEFWSPIPIIAWRGWRWTGSSLQGAYSEWSRDQFEASCDTCDEPPGWAHTCGVYAVAIPASLPEFFRADVIGRVELSGLVIEHQTGYRASHARILELWTRSPDVARKLRETYPRVEIHVGHPEDEGSSRG